MTQAPRLLLAAAVAVVAARAGPGLAPGPAAAANACDGVWVIVEPRTLAGSTTQRCAPGAPANGLAALEGAGHHYTFVPRQAGMVCTIDARPDPCNGAPADAYWAYFHAEAGASSWTYSTRGAGSRTPAPGTAEAWVYGGGGPPSTPPPAPPPASKAPPAPEGDSGGSSGSNGPRGPSSSSGSSGGSSGSTGSTGGSTGGTSVSGDASDGSTRSTGTGASEPSTVPSGAGERRPDEDDADATAPGASATGDEEEDAGARSSDGSDDQGEDADEPAAEGEPADAGAPDDDTRAPVALTDDRVSIGRSGGAGRAIGTALAGTLAAGIAAAGVVRVRRRDLGSGADLGG